MRKNKCTAILRAANTCGKLYTAINFAFGRLAYVADSWSARAGTVMRSWQPSRTGKLRCPGSALKNGSIAYHRSRTSFHCFRRQWRIHDHGSYGVCRRHSCNVDSHWSDRRVRGCCSWAVLCDQVPTPDIEQRQLDFMGPFCQLVCVSETNGEAKPHICAKPCTSGHRLCR